MDNLGQIIDAAKLLQSFGFAEKSSNQIIEEFDIFNKVRSHLVQGASKMEAYEWTAYDLKCSSRKVIYCYFKFYNLL